MDALRKALRKVRQADLNYNLIENGDRIAIGVSGGKDSLLMLYLLGKYRFYSRKNYEIVPIFIDLGFGKIDIAGLKSYVRSLGFELSVNDSSFVYGVLKDHQGHKNHLPCSICSRMKKAAIAEEAKRLKCTKISFAHHMDDALETLFMNIVHGGRIATFEPKMHLDRSGFTFIRPLFELREKEIMTLVKELQIPVFPSGCPADRETERESVKNALLTLYETYPDLYENFPRALENRKSFILPFLDFELTDEENFEYALRPIMTADDIRGTALSRKRKRRGEEDYLVLRRGERVAEISCRFERQRVLSIFNIQGETKALVFAISFLSKMKAKEENPLKVFLSGPRKIKDALLFVPTIDNGKKRYMRIWKS